MSNLVSAELLLILGIFWITVGDFGRTCRLFLGTGARRRSPTAKMVRNGAFFTIAWRARRDTALAGWGGRVRIFVWRNYRACTRPARRCRYRSEIQPAGDRSAFMRRRGLNASDSAMKPAWPASLRPKFVDCYPWHYPLRNLERGRYS